MKKEWPNTATPRQQTSANELLRRLHLKYPRRIVSTVLFGSVARGEAKADSDIDVLIVTDQLDTDFKWEIWGIAAGVSLDYDVIIDPHVYSRRHWEDLREKRRTLWRNVARDGVELKVEPVAA
ncbi:MAG: nucleotidyltransferase domain-containing protein [Chloroflexi bacterium]|nr:nucleotidyltransferase domain-containing protein [Chloroflexota bacterium]